MLFANPSGQCFAICLSLYMELTSLAHMHDCMLITKYKTLNWRLLSFFSAAVNCLILSLPSLTLPKDASWRHFHMPRSGPVPALLRLTRLSLISYTTKIMHALKIPRRVCCTWVPYKWPMIEGPLVHWTWQKSVSLLLSAWNLVCFDYAFITQALIISLPTHHHREDY